MAGKAARRRASDREPHSSARFGPGGGAHPFFEGAARTRAALADPYSGISITCHRSILFAGAAGAALLAATVSALAQAATNDVETVTVTAERLSAARAGIQTQLGASTYTVTARDIENQPGGANMKLNQVILQAPGVAQDSFGQLHIRGEHNGLQYRLNGIILPEGISVFGQTLDPRLAESVQLITGALPAEYGDRTGGIVDMQTKTGLFDPGGQVGIYGGSHSTITPSFDYGGSSGSLNYFVSGDYTTDTLGIESPDGSTDPLHDRTKQYHGFAFPAGHSRPEQQRHRRSLGTANDMFQIPNSPGCSRPASTALSGWAAECRQRRLCAPGERPDRLSVGKSRRTAARDHRICDPQLSALARAVRFPDLGFGRYSSLYFTPGANVGDILYDGIAQTAYKRDEAYGLQAEGAYHLGDTHTIRFGTHLSGRRSSSAGPPRSCCRPPTAARRNPNPIRSAPIRPTLPDLGYPAPSPTMAPNMPGAMASISRTNGRSSPSLTLNYGAALRPVPRLRRGKPVEPARQSGVDADERTTVHVGYSRYFSPPPIELVASTDIALFDNTTAAAGSHRHHAQGRARRLLRCRRQARNSPTRLTLGLDSYYKASHNMIDEGQFGAPIILTPFNYLTGTAIWHRVHRQLHRRQFLELSQCLLRARGRTATSSRANSSSIPAILPISPPITSRSIISRSSACRRARPITGTARASSTDLL